MPFSRLTKVIVKFSPFSQEARAAREFLARLSSGKARASNPQCDVVASLRLSAIAPSVTLVYAGNNQVHTFETTHMTADRMFERMKSLSDEMDSSEILSKLGGHSSRLTSVWDTGRNNAGNARKSEPAQS